MSDAESIGDSIDTFDAKSLEIYENSRAQFLLPEELQEMSDTVIEFGHVHDYETSISHNGFQESQKQLGERFKRYFTSEVYENLLQNEICDNVPIEDFVRYVTLKNQSINHQMGLFYFMEKDHDFLTRTNFYNWLSVFSGGFPQIVELEKKMKEFYFNIVTDKIFFYLDLRRANKIKFNDLLASRYITDISFVKLGESEEFGLDWVTDFREIFVALDEDEDELLSEKELKNFSHGDYTDTFIRQLYVHMTTSKRKMYISEFLRVYLTLTDMGSPASMHFIFQIVDLDSKGFWNVEDIKYFVKEIIENMEEVVNIDAIVCEVFDMASPPRRDRITFSDILTCGFGYKIVKALISFSGFKDLDYLDDGDSDEARA